MKTRKRRLNLAYIALSLSLVIPRAADAASWQVLYQTDFSSNPSWITNDSSRYYWDSSDGTYHANQINVNSGGYYSYYDVGHDGTSFRLEWDIKIASCDYASELRASKTISYRF